MNNGREQPLTGRVWWVYMLRGVLAAVLILMGLRFKQLKVRVEVMPPSGPS